MPISAVDVISPAFQHMKRQLLQPFRFGQWTRLAIVGLLAGELGSGMNFNSFSPSQTTSSPSLHDVIPKIDPAILGGLIAVLIVSGLVFFIVLTYISSVMRFILFDSVLAKECHIRAGWNRRQGPGWKYFLWQLGFMFVTLLGVVVLVGIPVAFAFAVGWFKAPKQHLLGLILGGIAVFFVAAIFFIAAAIIHVLTKDFVVPQMALEGIGAIEGWRRLWPMMQLEKGGYAVYVLMKIALAVGAGIVVGLVSLILALLVAIPVVGVGIAVVMGGKAAGLTWNVFTITAAVVAGCILLALFIYLMALISVPVIVFFPAYAIYFFAARYQALGVALSPRPAPAGDSSGGPLPEPPPLVPPPEPIG